MSVLHIIYISAQNVNRRWQFATTRASQKTHKQSLSLSLLLHSVQYAQIRASIYIFSLSLCRCAQTMFICTYTYKRSATQPREDYEDHERSETPGLPATDAGGGDDRSWSKLDVRTSLASRSVNGSSSTRTSSSSLLKLPSSASSMHSCRM